MEFLYMLPALPFGGNGWLKRLAEMNRFYRAFKCAINGIAHAVCTELNLKIQLVCSVFICIAGFILKFSHIEWIFIILCIGGTISFELVNTAIEEICNKISDKIDPVIGVIKDISAGAVLIFSITSLVAGGTIIISKFL